MTLWDTLKKEKISEWNSIFEDDLECITNEYTGAIHFTPSFKFQNYVYNKLTEPNAYSVTGEYTIKDNIKKLNLPFEAGLAWYNYEFSKNSKDNIFAVM
jgi:hypothetical protein